MQIIKDVIVAHDKSILQELYNQIISAMQGTDLCNNNERMTKITTKKALTARQAS